MQQQALSVYDWPASANNIKLEQGILVIALKTLADMPRAEVRLQIRSALQEALATLLACPSTEIEFLSAPGQALRLLQPQLDIGLAISHEQNMSLAAINIRGSVGIDLMALNASPTVDEIPALARDYLGSTSAKYITQLPTELQQAAFAKAWTELEARLKCRGEALIEWSPSRESRLTDCITTPLNVADGYVATLAYLNPVNDNYITQR